jgi:hypothetical protein
MTGIGGQLAGAGIVAAVADRDSRALFDWLIGMFSYQGISDRAAANYIAIHGNVTHDRIEAACRDRPALARCWRGSRRIGAAGSVRAAEPVLIRQRDPVGMAGPVGRREGPVDEPDQIAIADIAEEEEQRIGEAVQSTLPEIVTRDRAPWSRRCGRSTGAPPKRANCPTVNLP